MNSSGKRLLAFFLSGGQPRVRKTSNPRFAPGVRQETPFKKSFVKTLVIANSVLVLALTAFVFMCYHYLWLPNWVPDVFGFNPLAAFFAGAVGIVFLIAEVLILLASSFRFLAKQKHGLAFLSLAVVLVPIILAALTGPIRQGLGLRAARQGGVLIDAIHRYEKDHGSLPQDLQELVPKYVSHIPTPGLLHQGMNQFFYPPSPPCESAPVSFTLGFGLHGPMGKDVAVVYYPNADSEEAVLESDIRIEVSLPCQVQWREPHETSLDPLRRLDESWILL